MFRALTHYWRVNLAVLLGAAVATAVLAGALLVGDSVRGSLRDLTLDRLGGVDSALLSTRFFREGLADDLAASPQLSGRLRAVAPAIELRGSAVHADSGARASQVGIHGIDERFAEVYGATGLEMERQPGQIFPSVIVNESLRKELGAEVGDAILLNFGRFSQVPRDTLMGDSDPDDVLGSLRLTLVRAVPDRGVGRFGLTPNQGNPPSAFVALPQVQRVLEQRGRVNAIFVAHAAEGAADTDAAPLDAAGALKATVTLDDLGLTVKSGDGFIAVESQEFVLRPNLDAAIREVAAELGAPILPVQSYLANTMQHGDRATPYSMVSALDPIPGAAWAALTAVDGTPLTAIGPREVVLNAWTAEDLGAGPGDTIDMSYFVVGPREELTVTDTTFTVKAIAAFSGLADDRTLTPDYPGIREARDMAAWDPPFPVELDRIRPKDEDYWDDHGATPKAFVSEATGRELWSTQFGSTTLARLGVAAGSSADALTASLREKLVERLPPDGFGLAVRAVKTDGLAASGGATDFGGLFIAFSFFLIVSSALLVGLLFSLNVEQRAREVGLLLAVGYPAGSVRRRLLTEGGILAAVGGLLGLGLGIGYAALLMAGLRTLWVGAVGSSALYLHVLPTSLVVGFLIALFVVLLSIYGAVRRLKKIAPTALLAGSTRTAERKRRARLAPALAWVGVAGALGLLGYAAASGELSNPGLTMGSGVLLLIAGLGFFAMWCRARGGKGAGTLLTTGMAGMAARNSSWNPGRSILSVALVASACFVIVAVASNSGGTGDDLTARDSGSGGFPLVAEADVPLHQDLNRPADLAELGFSSDDVQRLGAAHAIPFRLLPGDDTSCLNLYQPEKPRVLGVPPEMIERGGFTFAKTLGLPEGETNPWTLLDRDDNLEPGVIPAFGDANSMQWVLHLALGQDLVLEDEYGQTVRLRLVGTLAGSVFQSEMLISEAAFRKHFPSQTGYAYFLIDAPAADVPEVTSLLEATLGPFGFDAVTAAEKLAAYKVVEHTYMSTFQMLGALGLLLGTIGLGVVLVRNVIERRGELATLRAFGFPRRSLAVLVLAENAFLLIVGMLIGTLSALSAAAPRLATIHVPWTSLSVTLLIVLAVGMLASILAVLGSLRVPLLPALKSER